MAKKYEKTPFGKYFAYLDKIDKGVKDSKEFGSILILGLVEEVGEMARAYLAEHGRKKSNIRAQADETYEQELGDILVSILRFARIKNINLEKRIMYSLEKIEKRKAKQKKDKRKRTRKKTTKTKKSKK
jgi:NTP pyrophosphatase (non-canonical NTP hydrolase)